MKRSQKKALFLCAGSGVGGMERVVRNLASTLRQQDCDSHVILPVSDGAAQTQAWMESAGISAEISPALQHSFGRRRFSDVPALVALLRKSSASVVNFHYGITYPPLTDMQAARLAGKRCVVSLHSGGGADPPQSRSRIRKNHLASLLCDTVVAVSQFQAEMLVREGIPRPKIHVLPCGLTAPTAVPSRREARQQLELPETAFVIATAARLTAQKGIADLILALWSLAPGPKSGSRPVILAIAGEGPERSALEDFARELLPGRCRFLGFQEDISPLYAAADLFALPSYEESFGQVYAEAALHGVPSVGTKVGGVPENIREGVTGLLVPPGDCRALAHALETLMDDPVLRLRMGEAAQQRARAEFTIEKMTARYQEILFPVRERSKSASLIL